MWQFWLIRGEFRLLAPLSRIPRFDGDSDGFVCRLMDTETVIKFGMKREMLKSAEECAENYLKVVSSL